MENLSLEKFNKMIFLEKKLFFKKVSKKTFQTVHFFKLISKYFFPKSFRISKNNFGHFLKKISKKFSTFFF